MPKAPTLEPRLRFPHDGPDAFGPGKAELLRQIAATGSIRTAADRMAMSYNRAWILVRTMNTLFLSPPVSVVRGGAKGGGAQLTASGHEVLQRYDRMQARCLTATRRDWESLRRLLRA